jgi:hypothetical protein
VFGRPAIDVFKAAPPDRLRAWNRDLLLDDDAEKPCEPAFAAPDDWCADGGCRAFQRRILARQRA